MRPLSALTAVLLLASLFTSTETLAATPTSRLMVGIPSGLPGYETLDDNKLKINDPYKRAVTECIAGRLNAKFVWVAFPTKRIIQMLQTNEVDLIYPMGFTEDRAATMLQSSWVWQNPDALVSAQPVDMADKALRIAARLGSPQQTDYVADGYANMTATYAYEDLAKLLARGTVDVVIVPRSVYVDQKAIWPAKVLVSAGKPRASGFYLNRDDPKGLHKMLNDSIGKCRDVDPAK